MFGLFLTVLIAASGPLYEDPTADRLIRQAMEASYDLKLDEARAAARELQTRFPDHPAGFTIAAETYWWEAQAEKHNASVENNYYRAQELAVGKAESALKAQKYPQFEIIAYLASAHGSYARFQVTQKQAFFSALRAGLRAHKYAEQVYALKKDYYDIYVGLGAFNYFTGTLPTVIKPFAWLIGVRGDKDLGVQQFRTAIEKSRYSQTEGRIVFYTALAEDKQYRPAFEILEKLVADYPDNFVLYEWVSDWYRRQRMNLEGAEHFERIFQQQLKRSPLMAKYALFEKAGLQHAHKRDTEAKATLDRLKQIPGTSRPLSAKVEALEREIRGG